jgi:hypothetical protein
MFYNDLSRGSTSLSPVKLSVKLLDRQTDLSKDDLTKKIAMRIHVHPSQESLLASAPVQQGGNW